MTSIFGERLRSQRSQHQPTPKFARPNISESSLDLIGSNPDPDPFDTIFPCAPSFVCLCPSSTVDQTPTSRLKTPSAVSRRDCLILVLSFERSTWYSLTKLYFHFGFIPFHTHLPSKPSVPSHANSSKFSYSPRMRSRKPGEVTDQCSTLGLFSRHDKSSKYN